MLESWKVKIMKPKLSSLNHDAVELSCSSVRACCHVWLLATSWTSPPGSSVHGIFQARTLEWVAIPSSKGFSCPGISCNGRQISLALGYQGSLELSLDDFIKWK